MIELTENIKDEIKEYLLSIKEKGSSISIVGDRFYENKNIYWLVFKFNYYKYPGYKVKNMFPAFFNDIKDKLKKYILSIDIVEDVELINSVRYRPIGLDAKFGSLVKANERIIEIKCKITSFASRSSKSGLWDFKEFNENISKGIVRSGLWNLKTEEFEYGDYAEKIIDYISNLGYRIKKFRNEKDGFLIKMFVEDFEDLGLSKKDIKNIENKFKCTIKYISVGISPVQRMPSTRIDIYAGSTFYFYKVYLPKTVKRSVDSGLWDLKTESKDNWKEEIREDCEKKLQENKRIISQYWSEGGFGKNIIIDDNHLTILALKMFMGLDLVTILQDEFDPEDEYCDHYNIWKKWHDIDDIGMNPTYWQHEGMSAEAEIEMDKWIEEIIIETIDEEPALYNKYKKFFDYLEELNIINLPKILKRTNNLGLWDFKEFSEGISEAMSKKALIRHILPKPPELEHDLLRACSEGDIIKAEELLKKGANIDYKDNINGDTPLTWACDHGKLEIVKFLVDNHANINHKNNLLQTPLNIAAYEGYLNIVKYLVNKGADIFIKDSQNRTPLSWAFGKKEHKIVDFLIEYIIKHYPEKINDVKLYASNKIKKKYPEIFRPINAGLWDLKK